MKVKLTQEIVAQFSSAYDTQELTSLERYLFDELSPVISDRGFLDRENFLKICEWKTARTRSLVRENSKEEIEEITAIAFSCSEELRIRVLTLLRGVSVPTASAILSVWNPTRFTVYDFRVLSAVNKLDYKFFNNQTNPESMKYNEYLVLARLTSEDLQVSLRDLDKCLWSFDKYGIE